MAAEQAQAIARPQTRHSLEELARAKKRLARQRKLVSALVAAAARADEPAAGSAVLQPESPAAAESALAKSAARADARRSRSAALVSVRAAARADGAAAVATVSRQRAERRGVARAACSGD
jgi:hypothetical protein